MRHLRRFIQEEEETEERMRKHDQAANVACGCVLLVWLAHGPAWLLNVSISKA
jgi:hypothetical protein